MYYTIQNNRVSFHSTQMEGSTPVPEGIEHYSLAYRYPSTVEVLWHSQPWPRLTHLIKPIPLEESL